MDYFTARTRRFKAVSHSLMQLAQELKSRGYVVQKFASSNCPVHFRVVSGDYYVGFGFAEVPYRWWYGHSEYTHQTFGIYLPDGTPSDDCPFSADDILKDLTHRVNHFHDSIYEEV